MIDTHCHLSFSIFEGGVPDELALMRAAGVTQAITISTTSADARRARELATTHPELFFSVGVHPLYSHEPVNWGDLHDAAADPRCVAWGELGLDRHHRQPAFELQREVLIEQLDRVGRWTRDGLVRPIVVHCRDAFDDLLPILKESGLATDRMVFHCFSGTPEEARRVLDLGAWISFTGIITYANAPLVVEAAKFVPRDRIMVETDAPFLSPGPFRGQFPNHPAYVTVVAEALAAFRGETPDAFFPVLDANARRFFALPAPTVA